MNPLTLILAVGLLAGFCSTSISAQEATGSLGSPNGIRVMTYNTLYLFNNGKEEELGKKWVKEQEPDIVGLQELTNIRPERLTSLGKGWGHEYSSLLKDSGFSVGVTSRWPIEVLEKRLEGMHHGFLHVKTNEIHLFVTHLSPFDRRKRLSEAGIILESVKPLLAKGERVIVMGDFNTHSIADKDVLAVQEGLLAKKKEAEDAYAHVTILREGALDFEVLNAFFDAGLVDPGLPHFLKHSDFLSTFPTGILSEEKTSPPMVGERIDFILTGELLAKRVIDGKIYQEGKVNRISDHYPVILDLK